MFFHVFVKNFFLLTSVQNL